MDSYIKHIIEAFDFGTISKQNKSINSYDILRQQVKDIVYKIINDKNNVTDSDKNFILLLPSLTYQTTDNEIRQLVYNCIDIFGNECNLNWIDTSHVTNMEGLFYKSIFNGDISKWNVSNVIAMNKLFMLSKFNGDISQWDVSNVTDMSCMFYKSDFNGDISNWDVSNVTNMYNMFSGSKFNSNISDWDVSNVINMEGMFYDSKFNKNISDWDVSNVTNMRYMFGYTKFNWDISNWNVGKVVGKFLIFDECPIEQYYKPIFK